MLVMKSDSTPSLFNDFFGNKVFQNEYNSHIGYSVPAVNVKEEGDGFALDFAVPGFGKNDIKVHIEKSVLTVSAEKPENKSAEDYSRREFNYGSFERRFEVPKTAEQDKISATHQNGILTVRIPKLEAAKEKAARQVEIA